MSDQFQFDNDELAELRGIFFEQANEVIESLNELILKVERDPSDAESLRAIRRAVHTLKGDSTAFGYSDLTDLAHRYEDALDRVRAREGAASRALIDLLLAGADALAALINSYRGECAPPDTSEIIAGLEALRMSEADAPLPAPHSESKSETPSEAKSEAAPARKRAARKPREASPKSKRKRAPQIEAEDEKTSADLRPPVADEAANVVAAKSDATAEKNDAPAEAATVAEAHAPAEPPREAFVERRTGEDRRSGEDRRAGKAQGMTLRVESERIDAAMNLVGELIIQRSMIQMLAAEIEAERRSDELARRLSESVALAGRTLSELQESVMRMRLVAIDQVFRRFPRVVRDASIKLGKPLNLEIIGGHTEIDKSIVELISDPLIHLVRNACDHGIEAPDVRLAAGKSTEGTIRLRARRAGNQIEVAVEDDGGGINPERVLCKAIEKGLVAETEARDWTDQQKIALVFLPGFSTKEQISDMSGRGVGMDVVKTSIESLGGSVNVHSVMGQGSRFVIKLPLTMAIVRAMMFESAERRFALPLDSIREITRLRPGDAKTIDGREVLRLRDHVLPLVNVDFALGLCSGEDAAASPKSRFVFVVDLGEGRDVGLVVDRLCGEQELVLKTVDDSLTQSAVVAGASILGDGQVVLILEAGAIVEQFMARRREMAHAR